jgi:hypothetical protein
LAVNEYYKSRTKEAEIKFRGNRKYMLFDHKRNQYILKELKTLPVLSEINNYGNMCIQHVRNMDRSRFQYAIVKHQPTGKRNPGHPLKRHLGWYIDNGTGYEKQVLENMMMMIMIMSSGSRPMRIY